jgi:hypothetical protein
MARVALKYPPNVDQRQRHRDASRDGLGGVPFQLEAVRAAIVRIPAIWADRESALFVALADQADAAWERWTAPPDWEEAASAWADILGCSSS